MSTREEGEREIVYVHLNWEREGGELESGVKRGRANVLERDYK